MKRIYGTGLFLMVGVIVWSVSGHAAQWSAARRPGGSSPVTRQGTETVICTVTGETVIRGAAAAPQRPFLCRSASEIYRPRVARTQAPPPVPAAETAPVTEEKILVIETEETAVSEPSPAAIPSLPPAAPPMVKASPPPTPSTPSAPGQAKAAASYGKVPPYFIRNDGQLDPAVKYYVKGPRGTVYLTDTEIVFDFLQENPSEEQEGGGEENEPPRPGHDQEENRSFTRLVFRQQFVEPNPAVRLEEAKELPGKINYFIGSKENWRSNIPTMEEVVYHDLYQGIDMKCSFEGANIRQIYTVRPGVDPSRISYRYIGVDGLEIKPEGDLIVLTPFGGFVTRAPKAFQEIDGRRVEREAAFKLLDDDTVAIAVGDYDPQFTLVIE